MASSLDSFLSEATQHLPAFGADPDRAQIRSLGRGLINRTFLVSGEGEPWVLQRLNPQVFPRPERILQNLARLNARRAAFHEVGLRIPHLVPSREGRFAVPGSDGALWRRLDYLPGQSLETLERPSQAAEVGRLLGHFHRISAALSPQAFHTVLPRFHDTPHYLARLVARVDRCDREQRSAIADCLGFIQARRPGIPILARERLPLRIVHGDPKLDNFLFHAAGRRGLALIDLDTVQPGYVLQDLGDCLRSCGSCVRSGRIHFDVEIARALLPAYARATSGLLSPREIALLFEALRLLPLELGIRFLEDHLAGDRWFRVTAPGDNLRRARRQFALVEAIERQESQIRALIEGCPW